MRLPSPAAIEAVDFRNPRFPALPVEAMTLAELRARVPGRHLRHSSRPQFHQLIHLSAGQTPHFVDFVRYDLRPGTVLHVRPGQVQQLVLQSRSEGVVILFAPEFVPREAVPGVPPHLASSMLDAAAPQALLPLRAPERPALAQAFGAVLDEYTRSDGSPLAAAVLRHQVCALLLMLARASASAQHGAPVPGPAARVYSRFVRELERSFASARSVGWYARELGYSEKTLLRACQAMAGVPPKELIDRRVVLETKRLLAHTQQAVGSIAADVGFSETTNFVKFFRRREGIAPSEFRARQRSA
jgi:AraC-like DNA-binding protein